jgi:hypothetical protein
MNSFSLGGSVRLVSTWWARAMSRSNGRERHVIKLLVGFGCPKHQTTSAHITTPNKFPGDREPISKNLDENIGVFIRRKASQ